MNSIAGIGDRILIAQKTLGLINPSNFAPGLNREEFLRIADFSALEDANELQQLFMWRNGAIMRKEVPIMHLWLIPGFYLLPVKNAIELNRYLSNNISNWSANWYPLTSSGSADCHFVDIKNPSAGKFKVFYNDPEASRRVSIIYESVESMFSTILECYEQGAYFVGSDAALDCDYERVFRIARRQNPSADYWLTQTL